MWYVCFIYLCFKLYLFCIFIYLHLKRLFTLLQAFQGVLSSTLQLTLMKLLTPFVVLVKHFVSQSDRHSVSPLVCQLSIYLSVCLSACLLGQRDNAIVAWTPNHNS